jgi:hypothetical protein
VAGIGVYLWQRGEIRERDAVIARTAAANGDLTSKVTGVDAQIADLQSKVSSTEAELERAKNGLDVAEGGSSEDAILVGVLQTRLATLQEDLRAAVGPRLHHGMHIGFIVAVNPAESRLVLDMGRWFIGRAARQAAIDDGAIPPRGHLPGRGYLRNTDHSWRVVHIRSLTHVTLRHYQGADGPTIVSITALAAILGGARTADEIVRLDPFWVMVDDGEVIEITQQQYTAP